MIMISNFHGIVTGAMSNEDFIWAKQEKNKTPEQHQKLYQLQNNATFEKQ